MVGIRAGGDAGRGRLITSAVVLSDGLADDWEVDITACGHVDGAARGRVAGVEGDAGTVVVILEVRVDPGSGEGTGALEGKGGGVEEVEDVQVSQLHAHGLADTGSLVVGDGGVDDLQAVELTRALAEDRVHTDSTDTAATRSTSDDNADGVGTRSKVDTSMGVVGRVVGVVGADEGISVAAVVATDERCLEDELAVVVDGEGITAAGQVGQAEDSRANRDKVVGLADSGAGLAEVELVPAAIDFKVDWAALGVMVMMVRAGAGL